MEIKDILAYLLTSVYSYIMLHVTTLQLICSNHESTTIAGTFVQLVTTPNALRGLMFI